MIIGLAALFAALALVNTAAMATAERRDELATIRLLGGTAGQASGWSRSRCSRPSSPRSRPAAAIVAVSVAGVPRGVTRHPARGPGRRLVGRAASRGAAALALAGRRS